MLSCCFLSRLRLLGASPAGTGLLYCQDDERKTPMLRYAALFRILFLLRLLPVFLLSSDSPRRSDAQPRALLWSASIVFNVPGVGAQEAVQIGVHIFALQINIMIFFFFFFLRSDPGKLRPRGATAWPLKNKVTAFYELLTTGEIPTSLSSQIKNLNELHGPLQLSTLTKKKQD